MNDRALLLIDVQKGFLDPHWGERNNQDAETNIGRLLTGFRELNLPVYHVKHHSTDASSPLNPKFSGSDYMDFARPISGEPEFSKSVNSAFIGTNLDAHLRSNGIHSLVIAGLTTDHCVSTSTRMAGNLDYQVDLIHDATATFGRTSWDGVEYSAQEIHRVHLASLHGEFCQVRSTEWMLRQLIGNEDKEKCHK